MNQGYQASVVNIKLNLSHSSLLHSNACHDEFNWNLSDNTRPQNKTICVTWDNRFRLFKVQLVPWLSIFYTDKTSFISVKCGRCSANAGRTYQNKTNIFSTQKQFIDVLFSEFWRLLTKILKYTYAAYINNQWLFGQCAIVFRFRIIDNQISVSRYNFVL